jgi:hypothetical protein
MMTKSTKVTTRGHGSISKVQGIGQMEHFSIWQKTNDFNAVHKPNENVWKYELL